MNELMRGRLQKRKVATGWTILSPAETENFMFAAYITWSVFWPVQISTPLPGTNHAAVHSGIRLCRHG